MMLFCKKFCDYFSAHIVLEASGPSAAPIHSVFVRIDVEPRLKILVGRARMASSVNSNGETRCPEDELDLVTKALGLFRSKALRKLYGRSLYCRASLSV